MANLSPVCYKLVVAIPGAGRCQFESLLLRSRANRARRNMADPGVANGDGPTTTPHRSQTPSDIVRSDSSAWVDLYGLLLILLMLVYFGVLILVAGELLRWTVQLVRASWPLSLQSCFFLAAAIFLALLLARTIAFIVAGTRGTVTTIHDEVPEAREGLLVSPEQHPQLYRLVEDVGRRVGSPIPDEIRINYRAECYIVELRRFRLSADRRLILVLGLPHLLVLNESELGVILGHELAHFGRGDTRFTVFISRFLTTLQRFIDSMSQRWWKWVNPFYWFHWLYHRLFLFISSPYQRHLELRADRISASLYGGELAARTLLKDWLLSHQFMAAVASYDPAAASDNGRAGDNVFAWFEHKWHDFSEAGQDYLLARLEAEERPSFWDSHPTIAQRVQSMRAFSVTEIQPGRPARELLQNFPHLEQQLHDLIYAASSETTD